MDHESNVARWATAIEKYGENGPAICFRFVQDLKPGFERSSQPDRVIVVWKYEAHRGMPVTVEREQMDELEDTLGPALYADEFATLALVSTGENVREWIFYARSEDEFMVRLNKALAGRYYPVEIHTAHDPEWKNYQTFLDGVRGSGTQI